MTADPQEESEPPGDAEEAQLLAGPPWNVAAVAGPFFLPSGDVGGAVALLIQAFQHLGNTRAAYTEKPCQFGPCCDHSRIE